MNEKKSIGAWIKQITVKGEKVTILTFAIDGKKYTMWPNKFKKEPKHPDYNIYEDTWEKPKENIRENPKEFINDLPF
jgi:hypothetical protein